MKILDKSLLKIIKIIFVVDAILVVSLFILADTIHVINTQFAFFSSLLVTMASYVSYKKQVQKRSQDYIEADDRDELDKLDDPYELYSDDEINEEPIEDSQKIKEIINEEKAKAKKNSIKNTVKSLPSYLSMYRLVGYVILVVGFFYLVRHDQLHTVSYLAGFLVVPITAIASTLVIRKEYK
jgi:Ca2+/Na+ antiporter